MKKIFTLLPFLIALCAFGNPPEKLSLAGTPATMPVLTGCTTGTSINASPLTCSGSAESLGPSPAGTYRTLNLIAGNIYMFDDAAFNSTFITISNTTGTVVLASGTAPVSYSPTSTGLIRFYIHADANCGTNTAQRFPNVTCTQPACTAPSGFITNAVSSNSATLSWTANNQVTTQYEYYYGYENQQTPPATPATVTGNTLTISGLNPNATYHYWVRAVCGAVRSAYVYGGSFNTLSNFTCNGATFGMMPLTTFTPQYTGHNEIITLDGYAGQFSKVNIQANKYYIFSSSDEDDFITVTNEAGTVAYASGQTPLNWASGSQTGVIRYYTHLNGNFCSSQAIARFRFITATHTAITCIPPTYLTAESISNTTVRLNWVEPYPQPIAYYYYFNTTNIPPTALTSPSGGISSVSPDVHNLTPNTTYYWWMQSYCGTNNNSAWTYGGSFSTAVTSCRYPWDIEMTALTATTASFTWTTWNVNAPSYDFYYNTSSTAPEAGTTPTQSTNSPNGAGTVTGLVPGTKYYCWIRSNCGNVKSNWVYTTFTTPGAGACTAPSNLAFNAVTAATAGLSWNAPATAPTSYDVYYNTSSTAPVATATPSGNTTMLNTTLGSLTAGTTYYFWVRSNCGTTKSAWIAGGSFTTLSGSSFCDAAPYGMYPDVFTPACSGSAETIAVDSWPGEYSAVNIVANRQYTFSSSVATDFITITNAAGTVLYANGISPLVWQSGTNTGAVRYYLHTNAACGTAEADRTKRITCWQGTATGCNAPTGLAVSNITSNSVLFSWALPATNPSTGYQVYSATSATAPSPSLSTSVNIITDYFAFFNGLTSGATYYYWVRSVCGTETSAWIAGGSFTIPAFASCNGASFGLWPINNFTPACSGNNETIVSDAFAGEYSNINILPNKQYTFLSSVSTDYVTITNPAGTVIIKGASPLVWSSGSATGVIRYHLNTNSSCGTQTTERIRRIKCQASLGMEEESLEKLKIYPNPVTDVLTIVNKETIDNVSISNTLGQVIYRQAVNATEATIDFSRYAAGIYMVTVSAGNRTEMQKVIKN